MLMEKGRVCSGRSRLSIERLLFGIILVTAGINVAAAFNIDTRVPIVKQGPANSYFGFSLAHHWIEGTDGSPDTYK